MYGVVPPSPFFPLSISRAVQTSSPPRISSRCFAAAVSVIPLKAWTTATPPGLITGARRCAIGVGWQMSVPGRSAASQRWRWPLAGSENAIQTWLQHGDWGPLPPAGPGPRSDCFLTLNIDGLGGMPWPRSRCDQPKRREEERVVDNNRHLPGPPQQRLPRRLCSFPSLARKSMQWVKLSEKEWMNADGCPWGGVWLFQGWMDRGRQGERAGRRNATLQPQPSRAKVDISESVIASSDRPTDRPRHSLPTLTNLPVASCFISTERPTSPSRRYLPVFLCIFFSFARSLFVGMSPTEPRS